MPFGGVGKGGGGWVRKAVGGEGAAWGRGGEGGDVVLQCEKGNADEEAAEGGFCVSRHVCQKQQVCQATVSSNSNEEGSSFKCFFRGLERDFEATFLKTIDHS